MHERNKHQGRYPMSELIATCPDLRPHVRGDTIDFSHPTAVRLLNKALLKQYYQIEGWDLPEGYLCPPIPGRADYVHHLADLIGQRGDASRILDIGVGANVIYPLLGNREYGWSFVGSDIDPRALSHAKKIVAQNHLPIELRLQPARQHILRQILRPLEHFAATMCNPPFHSSAEEAASGTLRKLRNLGSGLNFGGKSNELWTPGGEVAFVRKLIEESSAFRTQVGWFTTLVSRKESLPPLYKAIAKVGALKCETINMSQGQKVSRIIAWTWIK